MSAVVSVYSVSPPALVWVPTVPVTVTSIAGPLPGCPPAPLSFAVGTMLVGRPAKIATTAIVPMSTAANSIIEVTVGLADEPAWDAIRSPTLLLTLREAASVRPGTAFPCRPPHYARTRRSRHAAIHARPASR